MQLSLELEYWTVDDTGALASAAPVLDRVDSLHAESADPMLEVVTEPCADVPELRAELADRLREVIEVARSEGRRIVPLGTPLNAGPIDTSDGPRTAIQRRVLGEVFDYAPRCAGTHLHVDQIEGAEADQLNLLTALDPAFALVASSPYHQGRPVAACARSHVYRRTCYADHPRLGRLWPYVDDVAEWEERIDATFERFRGRALASGVDPGTFDEHFAPEDSIWAPVRLREKYDTVEWRAPDTALPSQILRLVEELGDVLALVEDRRVEIGGRAGITSSTVSLPSFDWLQGQVDTAMDRGLESAQVRNYLGAMGFDHTSYSPISAELDDAPHVSRAQARELRLRYADRLERDVGALAVEPTPTSWGVA